MGVVHKSDEEAEKSFMDAVAEAFGTGRWLGAIWVVRDGRLELIRRTTCNFPDGDRGKAIQQLRVDLMGPPGMPPVPPPLPRHGTPTAPGARVEEAHQQHQQFAAEAAKGRQGHSIPYEPSDQKAPADGPTAPPYYPLDPRAPPDGPTAPPYYFYDGPPLPPKPE